MSQAVELARSLRRDGLTLQKIVEVFKAQGIQSRRGKTPSVMTISRWCVGIPRPRVNNFLTNIVFLRTGFLS